MNPVIEFIVNNEPLMNNLLNVVLIVVSFAITWFVRTYVKSADDEKKLAIVGGLARMAITAVEDFQKTGKLDQYLDQLNLPDDVKHSASNGLKKFNVATELLKHELQARGIKVNDEEARKWVASEFQNLAGDLQLSRGVAERTQEAIGLFQELQQHGLIQLPGGVDRFTKLANYIADWAVTQQDKAGRMNQQADAFTKAQAALLAAPAVQPNGSDLPLEDHLAKLAGESVIYAEDLSKNHPSTGVAITDMAAAYTLMQATEQGLSVTPDQIARAVRTAFERA